ncbi:hypothetical protein K488DRAFT_6979, partial [Vararia minispora EC-137]
LRKSELSWKREFVVKHQMRRRWLRSRTSMVTHIPHYATISDLHMLSEEAILSSSIQYGIVARSFPFNGKIVKGYLNATGMHHGIGFGNPNAEFLPDVTACSISSDGSSAKILWGRRDGSVAVMWHPRTMNSSRAATKINASAVEEEHRGAVLDAVFTADSSACVTVGADGFAKIWSLKRFGCAWTSPHGPSPEPFTKILEDLAHGILACTTDKGVIVLYYGFDLSSMHTPGVARSTITQHRISLPSEGDSRTVTSIEQIFLGTRTSSDVSLLVRVDASPLFYRLRVNMLTGLTSVTSFGDPSSGPLRVISPVFSTEPAETSFVVAGDQTGSVSIYAWDAVPPADKPVPPSRRVDVFVDASVTALAVHPLVIALGSSKGSVRVIDALTLELLKSFVAPVDQSVRRIVVKRDMMVAAVGSRVIAWKGEPVRTWGQKAIKGKTKAKQDGERKWHKQIDLRRDIAESRDDIDEESAGARLRLGQERAQTSQLSALGLSEREAVEYVLMLSRDEANASGEMHGAWGEEGVFELDDNDLVIGRRTPSSSSASSDSPLSAPATRPSSLPAAPSPPLRPTHPHRAVGAPSASNVKVQVSPRVVPEPTEAG